MQHSSNKSHHSSNAQIQIALTNIKRKRLNFDDSSKLLEPQQQRAVSREISASSRTRNDLNELRESKVFKAQQQILQDFNTI
jgi:hypothetical protein